MWTGLLLSIAAVMSSAFNFSADIRGVPDTRPQTWGEAGYHEWTIKFNPPAGKRVRLLRAYGDFVAWPLGEVPKGKFAGVLFGLLTTAPDGSDRAVPGADNCPLYIQMGVHDRPERAAFDNDISAGGLLGPDHTLRVRVAVWLNETGLKIHMEPTFVLVYRWEDQPD